ncbi:MAG: Rieske (2Fe-2S) protein [Micrococcales bacterium]|nr:Rieske (2Fe-2S) protein [Micrococcales bacterium]
MSERHTPSPGSGPADEFGRDAVRLDEGHIEGTGGLPDRFENPGLPPHVARKADLDEKAAKRAEKQVVGLFTLSILATLGFIVAYFAFDPRQQVFVPFIGRMSASNLTLGLGMGLSLLGIGLGAVHWAKTLMPDEESVEMRHPMRSEDEAREGVAATFLNGAEASQLTRRPLLKAAAGTALGLFAVPPLLQVAGSLGPLPHDELSHTFWDGEKEGENKYAFTKPRLVRDPENTPIKATDVTIGSVYHVLPAGLLDLEHGVLEEKAKAAVLLIRLNPGDFADNELGRKALDWSHEGIVAYSKICTHVGCPVGLYEQTTHHLLCPCHQSTFDVTQDCKVIFGPAKRALPQLKITVDDEGYLIAEQPFKEAVGPSFWERG